MVTKNLAIELRGRGAMTSAVKTSLLSRNAWSASSAYGVKLGSARRA
jgi:hypothetical protein